MIVNGVEMRPLRPEDARPLAEALVRNLDYLAPYEPPRPADFHTEQGQRLRVAELLEARAALRSVPWVLQDTADGRIAGAVNLNNLVLGPFRSSSVGYWIGEEYRGRGLATAAVAEVTRAARDEFGLHRLEAGTLLDNHASQRVLLKSGFEPFGTAPNYLYIDGAWRDHRLFQKLLHGDPPGPLPAPPAGDA
ncbi:GNAT family protein [Streptomyces sp. NPDC097619]|uniref:GNAT family N-acetyltransferase n=1 Tax=Streptomyces sp. NPDC097619 TaxID=3157228 RepID=UPI00332FBC58